MRTFLFALLLAFSGLAARAQFEGKIVYKITYKDLPPEMQQMAGMLPQNQTIWVKGDKNRFEQSMMQSNTIVIGNNASGTSTILVDAMGQKFKLSLSKEEMDKMIAGQEKPQITYTDETREIAGYTCHKAIVNMEGFDKPAIVYYTKEIPPVVVRGMENLQFEGMFLSYEVNARGINMLIEVTDIDTTPVDDRLFEIPAGYQEMPENMRAMMGIK